MLTRAVTWGRLNALAWCRVPNLRRGDPCSAEERRRQGRLLQGFVTTIQQGAQEPRCLPGWAGAATGMYPSQRANLRFLRNMLCLSLFRNP